ncbi:MAG: tRNA (adenosine(37)-N6)-threonylcarbamoyltransferase complex dimerization subunit type 1 TsaB [Thermogemmatispora sp.]|uniref:tRNA (adenosine(37)-N6)-threonylcarbamoyltransferase complex dimerization subunit type 1 TsaB n=1 Tax=Thermogemmatispora sp. TaxID=1968838 RepID=UPI0019DE33DF|nr:tRNA (adenosine(37)-N6)-threonylcarbamoyltransferase complex dimerization subunit type 1 TsaB [Thermogemmatispora sp.]MBE3565333.1 tRNA (adenosine(37)-N6)-threonylcarbamoyltransferase complex dimerization subunit type 1 TsaB [Thermogemmatispora sp.]
MLLLAIDSSTRQASLALCSEETLYAEETWLVENNHSVELLPAIRRLLTSRNWRPADLSALAVALARSLAFALEKPLIGVGTLDIIAAQQRRWSGPICAVLEAGRSELYAACYLSTEGQDEQGRLRQELRRLGNYVLLPLRARGLSQGTGCHISGCAGPARAASFSLLWGAESGYLRDPALLSARVCLR